VPDRIIRDELLESSRVIGLPNNDARFAFVVLVLRADDFGNLEGDGIQLRRMWRDFGIDTPQACERCLGELVEVDLCRTYEVDGKRLIHIPRFRQRIRYQRRAQPLSPWNNPVDNLRLADGTVPNVQQVTGKKARPKSDRSQTVVHRSEVKRSKPKGSSSKPVVDSKIISNAEVEGRARARKTPPTTTARLKKSGKGNGQDKPPDGGTGTLVESIPTLEGVDFEIHESLAHEFERLYPRVDIPQTLREIRGYNLANPNKRKPLADVLGHVVQWLKTEQNGGTRGDQKRT
jgi:hypothetical protein